ncbi:MAG: helicase C-terminal domain-containing protein [Arcobacteraceae bacterium]|nr:helicase C-terminal domain-containing protein [Arcobacteraceae bacterium]
MGYENFKKRREQCQKEAIDIFLSSKKEQITVIESPTGSGKTHIALKSAIAHRNKYSQSVIISTNTNKNALEIKNKFLENFDSFENINKEDLVVEIGKSNYIDLDLLIETINKTPSLFEDTTIKKENIINKYTIDKKDTELLRNDVLLDDFIKDMDIPEQEIKKYFSFSQDVDISINPKEVDTLFDALQNNKIIIMNHAYLFIIYRIYGSMKNISINYRDALFNTPIIFDEFHTLFDSAKTILTKSFSLFRLKYSIEGILKHIEEDNNTTHIERLKKILSLVNKYQMQLINENNKDKALSLLSGLKIEIQHITNLSKTSEKLAKIENLTKDTELEKYIRFAKNELNELNLINFRHSRYIKVSFSPKGYPRIEITNSYPTYEIKKTLWTRNNSKILCLSGTLRTSNSTTKDAFNWCISRNGLFHNNEDEFHDFILNNKGLNEDTKEMIIAQNKLLNIRIQNIQFKTFYSLFVKDNYLYTIVNNEALTVPLMGSKDYEEKMNIWRKNIATFISNTIQYNSLVLSTSYEDAKAIGERIKDIRGDMEVFIATEGNSMAQLIDNYKKSVDEEKLCCIVGTEQYYTGLDLAGKYLHEMFLVKIPFSPPKGKVGNKIIEGLNITKDENYLNEVIIKYSQGIGRPIRDYNDKAVLYILDGRIKKPKNQIFQRILDKKATNADYSLLNSKYKIGLLGKPNGHFSTGLYTLFFSHLITKTPHELYFMFEIKKEEIKEVEQAANIILNENINIEKIMSKEYFEKIVEEKSYKNIWILLLKIYTEGMKQKGANIEEQIIKNRFFDSKDLTMASKDIFQSLT